MTSTLETKGFCAVGGANKAQKVHYKVRMVRSNKRDVIRHYHTEREVATFSARQLVGFLTHRLFGDNERGADGTHYVVEIRRSGESVVSLPLELVTVVRVGGEYRLV